MKQTILFITPYMPYPLNSGGNQGQFHMIDEIRKYYDTSIIFEVSETEKHHFNQLQKLWPDVHFFPLFGQTVKPRRVKKRPLKKLKRYIQSLFKINKQGENLVTSEIDFVKQHSTLFFSAFLPVKADFIQHLDQCLAQQSFDIIQVEFYEYLSLIHSLENNRAKKIFVHHELRYIRNEREMALYKTIHPHDQYLFNAAKEYEITTLRLYDRIITVSDIDKQLLTKYIKKSVYSSPSVIRQETLPDPDIPLKNRIVFVGGSHHFPNRDGIVWFLERCWPMVVAANPDVQLDIIGSDWNYKSLNIADKAVSNVTYRGYVENMSEAIAGCIMIVPLRIGSGMRMKIMDGVNNACSIVTTTVGTEGIDLISEVNCLIADNAEDFSGAITRLLNEPDLRRKLLDDLGKTAHLQRPEEQLKKRIRMYSDILKSDDRDEIQ